MSESEHRVKSAIGLTLGLALLLMFCPARAAIKYDPGASDTEIKVGNIIPYSGPASAFATYGRVFEAYFKRINENGGINGRKVTLISYDDAYSPPKTVEQARRLVEGDEVLFLFGLVGTPTNAAIMKYMNLKRVPQLFAGSGSSRFADPEHFPWTIGFQPNYQAEGRLYASWLLANRPAARIGVLYQDDDFGKDLLKGLTDGLGEKAKSMIVASTSYDVRASSADSQVVMLKDSGADVLMDFATPKFAAQTIRKVAELGWKPTHFLATVASHVGSVLKPAGLENAVGVITGHWLKDPNDARLHDDPGILAWRDFMARYYPKGDQSDNINVIAYVLAQTLERVLEKCGEDLSRENIMRQAVNLGDAASDLLIPGVRIMPSPKDYLVVRDLRLDQFDGTTYRPIGAPVEMTR
jgi:branched-chain amino acid transport system substrate-binding protein